MNRDYILCYISNICITCVTFQKKLSHYDRILKTPLSQYNQPLWGPSKWRLQGNKNSFSFIVGPMWSVNDTPNHPFHHFWNLEKWTAREVCHLECGGVKSSPNGKERQLILGPTIMDKIAFSSLFYAVFIKLILVL